MRRLLSRPLLLSLAAPAVLAGLVLLFYRQAAFSNLIFARGDTLLYFYPYWDFRARALLAGRLPLWDPYLFMGAPFLANSQAGVFYPLNWPLSIFTAPIEVKISLVVHVLIAAWGAYALARRGLNLERAPAGLAALVFALGGYLSAQVEHVNQLQGLAWLPAVLLTVQSLCRPGRKAAGLAALAGLIALQLTAGHTQTTFITLTASLLILIIELGLWPWLAAGRRFRRDWLLAGGRALIAPGLALALAFGLAAAQLIPTLELSRLSLRGGGLPLNAAVSFSLNPLLLGRALLPGYSRGLFSEFVGYIGLAPLALALMALPGLRRDPAVQTAALLAGLGLFFALGGYNPVYLLLARFAPGFNLFRAPARWLALWALGAALLSGAGLQALGRSGRWGWTLALAGPAGLLGLAWAAAPLTPPGETGPLGAPALSDLALWLAPLLACLALTAWSARQPAIARAGVLILAGLELGAAGLILPLNHLTAPDAYSSIRPAMTELLAAKNDSTPPDRFLSLSALEFDPGDLAELHSEWDSQLPADAVYDAIVATKLKEVLSPDLPLTWEVPAVDGYDGGILPLRAWADFARGFGPLPAEPDGRLRQFLKAVPPNWLLSLTDTRWIITDKTGDAWVDNVFYDLGQSALIAETTTLDRLPPLQATHLGLVLASPQSNGAVQVTLADGQTVTRPISPDQIKMSNGAAVIRIGWGRASQVKRIDVFSPDGLTLRGASLIDARTGSFQSITLGPYRLAHSGDVKIYENLNTLPRAFLLADPPPAAGAPDGLPQLLPAAVRISSYTAERVVVEVNSESAGYLVLTDADYPGWTAAVDGAPVPIQKTWGLFRSVPVPAGSHQLVFSFAPRSVTVGAAVSGIALLVWLLIALSLALKIKPRQGA